MREKIKPKELREYRVFSYSRTSLSFILRRLRYAVHRAPRRVSPSSSSAAAGFLDVSRRNSYRLKSTLTVTHRIKTTRRRLGGDRHRKARRLIDADLPALGPRRRVRRLRHVHGNGRRGRVAAGWGPEPAGQGGGLGGRRVAASADTAPPSPISAPPIAVAAASGAGGLPILHGHGGCAHEALRRQRRRRVLGRSDVVGGEIDEVAIEGVCSRTFPTGCNCDGDADVAGSCAQLESNFDTKGFFFRDSLCDSRYSRGVASCGGNAPAALVEYCRESLVAAKYLIK